VNGSFVAEDSTDAVNDSTARWYCKYLYLLLFLECSQYLIAEADFILKRKKTSELEEIMKKLYSLIEMLFIA
jgi:hypothetical protein